MSRVYLKPLSRYFISELQFLILDYIPIEIYVGIPYTVPDCYLLTEFVDVFTDLEQCIDSVVYNSLTFVNREYSELYTYLKDRNFTLVDGVKLYRKILENTQSDFVHTFCKVKRKLETFTIKYTILNAKNKNGSFYFITLGFGADLKCNGVYRDSNFYCDVCNFKTLYNLNRVLVYNTESD